MILPKAHLLVAADDGSPRKKPMNATLPLQALDSVSVSVPAPRAEREAGAVSGAPRTLLRIEGAVALVGASFAYSALGARWSVFALLFLVPDLSMLGYLAGRRAGAACYNAAHSYVVPALLAALATVSSAHGLLPIACIWAVHVGFDRMLGYGLKYGSSFGDTHLGLRGSGR
jgi:hypothetical protein